jgi:hypothetical protein
MTRNSPRTDNRVKSLSDISSRARHAKESVGRSSKPKGKKNVVGEHIGEMLEK